MRAMILGAGLGTRLRPLTNELPKPVVPFFDRPLAAHALTLLAEVGVTDVVINTHYLGERVEPALRPFVPEGMRLTVAHEPVLLGTGGGVRAALGRLESHLGAPDPSEPILLMNGDVLFFPDLRAAIAAHHRHGALATMVVRAHARAADLGAIHLSREEGDRTVRRILGPVDSETEAMMFTGVHVLSPRAVTMLPEEGCIIRQGYVPWLKDGARIAAHVEGTPFRDCGTLGEYHAAHVDVLQRKLDRPRVELDARGWVAPDAAVDGASIEGSVVGAAARVASGVTLRRVVVWPGAEVTESIDDAVITPSATCRLPQ
jgi:mannose-1-phosphate guanylyltransferase